MTGKTSIQRTDDSLAMLTAIQIVPAPWGNVRRSPRTDTKWQDFLADVRLRGIIQAVTVRAHPDQAGVYELMAGYGRWEAASQVGCPIPALIVNCTDAEGVSIGLMENLQREDMGPVDEAVAAQTALTLCNGDYEEARRRLGWSIGRLKQRLHLTRCTPAVQEAITSGKLSLRHADLLAGVSAEAQTVLLPTIIEKAITVEALKEVLGKASHPLATARFDVGDCVSCAHNSQEQSSLFEEFSSQDGARCRNLVCFKQKTADMLASRREELSARYGTVIILSEVSLNTVNHVGHDNVGAVQMFDGCLSCKKRVALLDDRLDSAGEVLEDRCTDPDCFKQAVAKHQAAEAEAVTLAQAADMTAGLQPDTAIPQVQSSASKNKNPSKQAVSTASSAMSSAVISDNKELLRRAAVEAWGSDPEASQRFQLCVMLASLQSVAGKATFGRALPDAIANNSMNIEMLRTEIASSMKFIASGLDSSGYTSMSDVMIATLPHAPNAKAKAIAAWIPTPERLKTYTAEVLTSILQESGFFAAYEAANDAKALKKLKSQSKGDLIKSVGAFNFDWSSYAPSFYLQTL